MDKIHGKNANRSEKEECAQNNLPFSSLNDKKIDLRIELQEGLINVINQIDRGYESVMTMYSIAFYLGILLVATSAIASLYYQSDKSALILGGLGLSEIIASMIFKPAQDLQNSRGNLAQLYAANFNWINDVYNWNRFLERLDWETPPGQVPDFDSIQKVSEKLVNNTEQMMKLIESYCEKN